MRAQYQTPSSAPSMANGQANGHSGQFDDFELNEKKSTALRKIIGAVSLMILLVAAVSLATWSVNDPSITHAVDAPVQNIFGFFGASVSDLLMQFFGLSVVAILVPGLFISWRLFAEEQLPRLSPHLWSWAIGSGCVAIVAGLLPAFKNWPLPTGLGGIVGDALLKAPSALIGEHPTGWSAAILVLICGVIAFICLAHACFMIGNNGELPSAESENFAPNLNEIGDDDDGSSTIGIIFGMLVHGFFVLRFHFARMVKFFLAKTRTGLVYSGQKLAEKSNQIARNPNTITPPLLDKLKHWQFWKNSSNEEMPLTPLNEANYPYDHMNAELVPESHFGEANFSAGPYDQVQPTLHPAPQPSTMPNALNGQTQFSGLPEIVETDPSEFAPSHARAQNTAAGYDEAAHGLAPDLPDLESNGRVQPRPAPLAQSGRITREAQPSLPMGGEFELPTIALLSEPNVKTANQALPVEALEQNARLLEGVLEDFGVKGQIINVRPGPVVTMYELEPAPGIKSSRVIGLADDIARSMSAISARVAVVPGRNAIGIELPNAKRETVFLRELIASQDYENTKASLPLGLGKSIGGEPVVTDLAKTPHLLVAGTTGSGKSVSVNTMILSLLYKLDPSQCRMIMIDPKMLELSVYDGIPHLLTPVVTDPKKAVVALKWTVREMEERYKNMSKLGVRNIAGYNNRIAEAKRKGDAITRTVQTGFDPDTAEAIYETEELQLEHMPFIVVVIDEMADLMMVAGKEIEGAVQRLAQMARAAGIHVIMATQRPSVDVITGTIKANFPSRISFSVTSKIDSRTILGEQGAEQLLGMGDMLFMAGGGKIQRVHGAFVEDEEVEQIVAHLKTQGVPQYLEAVTTDDEDSDEGAGPAGTSNLAASDDPYDQAVAIVLRDGKASTSYVQRRLGIGYNRAATIIERMEDEGIIGPANHAGKREILVPTESAQEDFVS